MEEKRNGQSHADVKQHDMFRGMQVGWAPFSVGVGEWVWHWRGRQDPELERALGANVNCLKFILKVIRNHCRILCIFSSYLEQFCLCF